MLILGGTPGGMNALTNIPRSNNFLQTTKASCSSPTITGTIAVVLGIIVKPSS
jgi:hypothetical protein